MLSASAWRRVGEELGLSRRELELVRHVFDGKKLAAVASDMNLALGTVKTYNERIHRKLRVRDQRELALVVFGAYLRTSPPRTARRTTGQKLTSR
jgi:DNA-binding NarL/FixJ family response regulator